MRYIRMTWEFVKSNLPRLMLAALVPALILPVILDINGIFRFFQHLGQHTPQSFGAVFGAMFGIRSWWWIAGVMLILGVCSVFQSAMVGHIQRRMSYGDMRKLGVRNFFYNVNNYFLPTLQVNALFALFVLAIGFLIAVFCYLWAKMSFVVAVALSVATGFVFVAGALFVIVLFMTVLPNMTIKGYRLFFAIRVSLTACSKKLASIYFAIVLPLLLMFVPVTLLGIWNFKGAGILHYLGSFWMFFFLHVYTVPLMYVIFYDTEELERQDIAKSVSGREKYAAD